VYIVVCQRMNYFLHVLHFMTGYSVAAKFGGAEFHVFGCRSALWA
jgi:hypothetical protein